MCFPRPTPNFPKDLSALSLALPSLVTCTTLAALGAEIQDCRKFPHPQRRKVIPRGFLFHYGQTEHTKQRGWGSWNCCSGSYPNFPSRQEILALCNTRFGKLYSGYEKLHNLQTPLLKLTEYSYRWKIEFLHFQMVLRYVNYNR